MIDALRVVKVVWVDPHSVDEWTDVDDLAKEELCKIITIGILIRETKDKYVVALNFGNVDCSCTMILPKSAVLHVQEIAMIKRPYEV